jgi:hypothetical protein
MNCTNYTLESLEAQARALYEASLGFRDPWEDLSGEERDDWIDCARRYAEEPFAHIEDKQLRNKLKNQLGALADRACADYVLAWKHTRNRYAVWTPRRTTRLVRVRSCRSRRRAATVTHAADGGGGDDGAGQGDPDSSDPPKQPHSVVFLARKNHSFPLPWPRHGCCCVASERGRAA